MSVFLFRDDAARRLRWTVSLAALAMATPGLAQEAAPQHEQRLGGMTVTDSAIVEDEAETGYHVSRSISATRTDTPLVNVPQSVSVVTAKQVEDQAANSIGEAIRYIPGVFSAQGEGNRETLVFRGNTTTGDFFVDGVRDDVQTYRDLYNIQRLEVFRGPNAMIFGRGGTGGVINRVTKVADWNLTREFRVEAGSYEHVRSSFDLGTPLNDFAAVRLTGVYQDSGSYRDGVNYNRWGFNPTAAFRLGPDTLVQIGYEHFMDERVADRGVPSQFRPDGAPAVEPLDTPRGQFFGDPTNSPTYTNTDAGTLFIEHRFSDAVVVRNRTRYADYDKFYRNVFPGAVNAAQTTVSISAYENATQRKNFFNQTDLNAEFETGAIKHTLLVGAEYGRQKTDNVRREGYFPGTCATPTRINGVDTCAYSVAIAASNVRRPDIIWAASATSPTNYSVAEVLAGYVQDQIELSPALQLILGIRYEHFKTDVLDRRGAGTRFEVTDNLWSPRAGLIFKPLENASLYASYSRTYLPRGGDQLASLSASNENLAPEKYQNYEIGAKWDITPRFNVAAAIYQLDRDNVIVLADPNSGSALTELGGGQRSRGVELSAAGSVTDAVSIIGAYTYQDAEFTRAISATVTEGNNIPNAPKHSASLWTRFDPTPVFGAGIGVIHQGRRFAAQDNLVVMPSYTRVDGALYWTIAENLTAQVNVENIFGERYFLNAHTNNNITPGAPRNFKASLSARF